MKRVTIQPDAGREGHLPGKNVARQLLNGREKFVCVFGSSAIHQHDAVAAERYHDIHVRFWKQPDVALNGIGFEEIPHGYLLLLNSAADRKPNRTEQAQ